MKLHDYDYDCQTQTSIAFDCDSRPDSSTTSPVGDCPRKQHLLFVQMPYKHYAYVYLTMVFNNK